MSEIEQLYDFYKTHPVITTDSRHCPKDSIFFALKGANFDGNRYAHAALQAGCALAVVDDVHVIEEASRADGAAIEAGTMLPEDRLRHKFFLVRDVLATLQELAEYHRQQFPLWERPVKVIGITGTNGKTTTKELMNAVLSQKYNVLATVGNLNNHIGVPLTLLRVQPGHDFAIIEMGANHPDDICELCSIVHPDFGLITTVAKGHLLGFGSFEGVVAAKTELYRSLRKDQGVAFINAGNDNLVQHVGDLPVVPYAVGEDVNQDVNGQLPAVTGRTLLASPLLNFMLNIDGNEEEVHTHLVGTYNLLNMVAAASVGHYFGVEMKDICTALQNYIPGNMRSQLMPIGHGLTLILDAYNANPDSMMAALQSFAMNADSNKQLILGDMGELGKESQTEHRRLLDYLIESPFDQILLVGSEFHTAFESLSHDDMLRMGARHTVRCYASVAELSADTNTLKHLLGVVLIKGSRSNALEKVVDVLKELNS